MPAIKVAVIYYSATGTTYQLARAAADAARGAKVEVRLRKAQEFAPDVAIDSNPTWRQHVDATREIPEAALEDLDWADAYLFGSPTRYGNIASQLKQLFDQAGGLWLAGKLANKVVSCFTSAHNPHGGQETTLLAMYNTMYHWGCFIVPPGYTNPSVFGAGGNPYGTSCDGTVGEPVPPEIIAAMQYQAQRVVQVAVWLAAGQAALAE